VVSKVVPKKYAIQDSKSIVRNADKNLDIILESGFIENE
jgi:hypothetical protein